MKTFIASIIVSLLLITPFTYHSNSISSNKISSSRIVFQSLRDAPPNGGNIKKYWELYSMNEDGSDIRRITNDMYWENHPDVSPDGSKILFAVHFNPNSNTTETDSGWEIATIGIDGKNFKRLTNNNVLDALPRWNYDGSKIVYVSDSSGNLNSLDIYTMTADGKNITKITDAEMGEFYTDPSFSSGKENKIIYVHSTGYSSNFNLCIMDEDGSNKKILLSTNSTYLSYHDPMFSRDDEEIVFDGRISEDGNHGIPIYKIFILNLRNMRINQITDNDKETDVVPQFSPDGIKIAYFTWSWNGNGFDRKIRVIYKNGLNERIISTFSPETMPTWYVSHELEVEITEPENALYIFEKKILPTNKPIIIGGIIIEANARPPEEISKVEFYIDDKLKYSDENMPYSWVWNEKAFGSHEIKVVAYGNGGKVEDRVNVMIFNIG